MNLEANFKYTYSPYSEAMKVADEYDKGLTAYDFHPNELVIILHEEGTQFIFRSAFLREWKDYVMVFTEHHKFHVYHKTDLYSYGQFKEQYRIDRLEDSGYTDRCFKCGEEFKTEDLFYTNPPGNYDPDDIHSFCFACKDLMLKELDDDNEEDS